MSEFEWVDDSGISSIDVCKYMQFCGGNCFKYLYRAGQKGFAIEDLKKAAWYAERAWTVEEVVNDEAMIGIEKVAKYRNGHIQIAMNYIREDMWAFVERTIKMEIQRLESKEGDK